MNVEWNIIRTPKIGYIHVYRYFSLVCAILEKNPQ